MRFHNVWCYRNILLSKGFAKSLWKSRKNLAAAENNLPLPAGPYMAELDVTYRCNLQCQMCQRWRDPRRDELAIETYRGLAVEFDALGVHQISIAGGEPLLREDVFSIIAVFAERGMSVNLCTNGMLVEKYRRRIAESGATCVTVSLDAATADRHDEIRGKAGSFRQIERGIISLLEQRSGRKPILRVRMTVSNANANEIRQFYEQWHGLADDVLFQPVHHCTDSYYTGMPEAALNLDASVISSQLRGTPLATDPYMRGLITSLSECGAYPSSPCYAGVLMARIDPWGNVYPCLEQHVCVGSVRRDSFSDVWNSKPLKEERKRLASRRNCRCWYNNTALIGHFGTLIQNTISGRKRCSSRWPQEVSP
ncbi:MAG: radical SAM/SPASM domain-containing protein [Hyphomicrobiales bacterium]